MYTSGVFVCVVGLMHKFGMVVVTLFGNLKLGLWVLSYYLGLGFALFGFVSLS